MVLFYKANGRKEIKHVPFMNGPPVVNPGVSEPKTSSDGGSSQQSSRGIVSGSAC